MLITVLCCGIDSPGWTGSQDITDLVVVVVGSADGGTFLGKGRRKRETRRATRLPAQVERQDQYRVGWLTILPLSSMALDNCWR